MRTGTFSGLQRGGGAAGWAVLEVVVSRKWPSLHPDFFKYTLYTW